MKLYLRFIPPNDRYRCNRMLLKAYSWILSTSFMVKSVANSFKGFEDSPLSMAKCKSVSKPSMTTSSVTASNSSEYYR